MKPPVYEPFTVEHGHEVCNSCEGFICAGQCGYSVDGVVLCEDCGDLEGAKDSDT